MLLKALDNASATENTFQITSETHDNANMFCEGRTQYNKWPVKSRDVHVVDFYPPTAGYLL